MWLKLSVTVFTFHRKVFLDWNMRMHAAFCVLLLSASLLVIAFPIYTTVFTLGVYKIPLWLYLIVCLHVLISEPFHSMEVAGWLLRWV